MASEGNLGSLYFTLGLDDKDFKTKMSAITQKYGGLINEIQKVKSPSKAAADAQQGLADSAGNVASEAKKESSALQKLAQDVKAAQNAALQEIATSGKTSAASREKVAASQRLSQQYRDMKRELNGLSTSSDKAAKAHENLTKKQKGLGASLFFSNGEMKSSIRLSGALTNQMGALFSIYAAERFLKSLVEIRGEFEMQQIALRAILRDAEGADKIFAQLQGLAVKSPFQFKDLVSYAKQLSAFSVPIEELYGTTKTLADISSGLGVDMSRIIIAYGQVKSAAVLRGQELRQFTEAGIPLVDELAKKFTELSGTVTTTGEVFDKISKREVPFSMVAGIFEDMTSAGGKFYNMQEKQAESLKGKMSNLADAFQISMNRIGQSQDGVLKGGVDFAMSLAKNFETVLQVLGTVVVAIGAYKGAQAIAFGLSATKGLIENIRLISMYRKEMGLLTAAQQAFNIASKQNIYIAIAQVIATIGAAIWAFNSFSKSVRTAQEVTDDLIRSTTALDEAGEPAKKLASQYAELTTRLESGTLTADAYTEADKRRKVVMTELQKLTAEAVITEGAYGTIVGINTEAIDRYTEVEKRGAANRLKITTDEAGERVKIIKDNLKAIAFAIDNERKLIESSHLSVVTNVGKVDVTSENLIPSNRKADQAYLRDLNKAYNDALAELNKIEPGYDAAMSRLTKLTQDMQADSKIAMNRHVDNLTYWLDKATDWTSKWNKNADNVKPLMPGQIPSTWQMVPDANGWQQQINKKLSSSPSVKRSGITSGDYLAKEEESISEYIKRIGQLRDEQNSLYIAEDNAFKKSKIGSQASVDGLKAQRDGYDAILDMLDAKSKAEVKGESAASRARKAREKSEKEALENQISLIKEAYAEYEKLNKYMDKSAAAKTVMGYKRYEKVAISTAAGGEGLSVDAATSSALKAYPSNKAIQELAKKDGAVYIKSIDESLTDGFDDVIKNLKSAIDSYSKKYDLYEKLLEITGDDKAAMALSFGKLFEGTILDKMKAQFKERAGFEFDANMILPETTSDEVKDRFNAIVEYAQSKDTEDLLNFQKMAADAMSANDKIKILTNKRNSDILTANGIYLSKLQSANSDEAVIIKEQWDLVVKGITASTQKSIDEINSEAFKLTPVYKEIFQNISDIAVGNIDDILKKTEDLISKVRQPGSEVRNKTGDVTAYRYSKEGDKTGEMTGEMTVSDLQSLIDKAKELRNEINKNPFKAIFDLDWDSAKEGIQGIADIDWTNSKQAFKILGDSLNSISAKAKELSGELTSAMGELGASDESKSAVENIMQVATGALTAGAGVAKLASGDIIGGVKDLATGIVNVIGGLGKMKDAKYEKQIEKWQKQVDATAKSYDKLSDSMSDMTKASAEDQAATLTALLETEKILIKQQMDAEKAKKKTDKAALDDYQDRLDVIDETIEDLAAKGIEYVLGGSIGDMADSWASTLTSALDSAFSNGTDAATAWGDSVNGVVDDIVKNFLINSVLAKKIEAFLTDLTADWINADGSLNKDAVTKDIPSLKDYLNNQYAGTADLVTSLTSQGLLSSASTTAASGLKGEVSAMTEPTASRLTGLLYSILTDSGKRSADLKTLIDAHLGSGINVYDSRALLQLTALVDEARKTRELVTSISSLLNDVTGYKGSTGKGFRVF